MAFFNGLKRAFGFSNGDYTDDYEDDEEYESAAVIQRPVSMQTVSDAAETRCESHNSGNDAAPTEPAQEEIPTEALDTISDMLNESLPQWAAPHIDVVAQKAHIWEMLKPKLNVFITRRVDDTVSKERQSLERTRNDANARVREAETAFKEMQVKSDEIKSQLLSLERQKSVISQRTRDLENKVAQAEAENEQFRLENKSLMNKLKVEQVKTDDVDFYKTEVKRLTGEIERLNAQEEAAGVSSEVVAELKKQLQQKDDELVAIKKHTAEQVSLQTAELAEQKRIADNYASIITELQSTQVKQQAEIDATKEKLRLANEEIQSLMDENSEAKENRMILQRIEQEFETLEARRKASEERAVRAESKAAESAMMLAESERKIDSLNQRISEIERAQSLRIKEISKAYEKEIAAERAKAIKAKAEAVKSMTNKSVTAKIETIDIDEISDDLDTAGDWLKPMTVENAPETLGTSHTDDEKPTQQLHGTFDEDPRQMSLFD